MPHQSSSRSWIQPQQDEPTAPRRKAASPPVSHPETTDQLAAGDVALIAWAQAKGYDVDPVPNHHKHRR